MKDRQGRAYATVAQTKAGDVIEADADFTCIKKGAKLTVVEQGGLLSVPCRDGGHHLDGQIKGRGARAHYVGLYPTDTD